MLVAKLFIQTESVPPSGPARYVLGAVCRGEDNKDWAAATPAATLETPGDPVLDAVWARRRAGEIVNPEVYVQTHRDPDGRWLLYRCEFSYGGVAVEWRRQGSADDGYSHGKYSMTINNSAATDVVRRAFADSLVAGEPARFTLTFLDATP